MLQHIKCKVQGCFCSTSGRWHHFDSTLSSDLKNRYCLASVKVYNVPLISSILTLVGYDVSFLSGSLFVVLVRYSGRIFVYYIPLQ